MIDAGGKWQLRQRFPVDLFLSGEFGWGNGIAGLSGFELHSRKRVSKRSFSMER